jgi:hypothetical protein
VAARAPQENVILPEKFYMGFPIYQGEPPKGPAAPPLYRELRALEAVMNVLLEVKNVQLKELTRAELKEEQGPKVAAPSPGKKPDKDKGEEGRKLVQKDTFTLRFSTSQENFQRILNGIATHKEQFFIPRYVVIANEKKEAPPKVAVVAAPIVPAGALADASAAPGATSPPAAPGATPPAAPAPAAEGPKLEYIFGKELVDVTMDIDLVDVKEVEARKEDKR